MDIASAARPRGAARLATLHLSAFVLPVVTLGFWLTGPHGLRTSLTWAVPLLALVFLDDLAPRDTRQPPETLPSLPFDLQLGALFVLQLANYVLLGVTASRLHLDSVAGVREAIGMFGTVILLTGINAAYSGIVVAHELIHRRNPVYFLMGRILLSGVLYEHFATEHVRGHHPRIGTAEDPATARFGDSFGAFFRRTVPGQFRSAWKLEEARVGTASAPWYCPRRLRNRVLQGVLAEAGIVIGFASWFGPLATFFLVEQAFIAILMLELVNYIEHWGLSRASHKIALVDSWDADHSVTLRTMVGLSRHADHHAHASRPFYKLRRFEETAKMPSGYYGTVLLALLWNGRYRQLATEELERKGLGPFRAGQVQVQLPRP